jgi:hypothetical protein
VAFEIKGDPGAAACCEDFSEAFGDEFEANPVDIGDRVAADF